jgi:hypothetical protein
MTRSTSPSSAASSAAPTKTIRRGGAQPVFRHFESFASLCAARSALLKTKDESTSLFAFAMLDAAYRSVTNAASKRKSDVGTEFKRIRENALPLINVTKEEEKEEKEEKEEDECHDPVPAPILAPSLLSPPPPPLLTLFDDQDLEMHHIPSSANAADTVLSNPLSTSSSLPSLSHSLTCLEMMKSTDAEPILSKADSSPAVVVSPLVPVEILKPAISRQTAHKRKEQQIKATPPPPRIPSRRAYHPSPSPAPSEEEEDDLSPLTPIGSSKRIVKKKAAGEQKERGFKGGVSPPCKYWFCPHYKACVKTCCEEHAAVEREVEEETQQILEDSIALILHQQALGEELICVVQGCMEKASLHRVHLKMKRLEEYDDEETDVVPTRCFNHSCRSNVYLKSLPSPSPPSSPPRTTTPLKTNTKQQGTKKGKKRRVDWHEDIAEIKEIPPKKQKIEEKEVVAVILSRDGSTALFIVHLEDFEEDLDPDEYVRWLEQNDHERFLKPTLAYGECQTRLHYDGEVQGTYVCYV